jgi:hypothetical protein
MSESSGFFNAVADSGGNYDRTYAAEFFADYFNSFVTNGVFPNPSTNLQVLAVGTDMRVYVSTGKAWINGYYYKNSASLYFTLGTADGSSNRIDRLVLRYDIANRKISAVVKSSGYATTPTAPALQQDSDYYELAIADVYVGAGVTEITQSVITDQRSNTALCGWVNSLIQVDTTTLFTQYETWFAEQKAAHAADNTTWKDAMAVNLAEFKAAFNAWFADVKTQLGDDVAGSLLNKINDSVTFDTAGGTGTAITLTTQTLTNGYSKTFIASAGNSGAATTINNIPLYKPNSTTAPVIVAGKAYTVWYDSSVPCFFLKASATGTATAAQVLAGATFSNDNETDLAGAIPSLAAATYTPSAVDRTIAAGQYLSGAQTITAATIASVQLEAGNIEWYTESETMNTASTTFAMVKEIQLINGGGTIRVSFDLHSPGTGIAAYGRIYKNGVAIGTLRSVSAYTSVTYAEDFTFDDGDYIQLYLKALSGYVAHNSFLKLSLAILPTYCSTIV